MEKLQVQVYLILFFISVFRFDIKIRKGKLIKSTVQKYILFSSLFFTIIIHVNIKFFPIVFFKLSFTVPSVSNLYFRTPKMPLSSPFSFLICFTLDSAFLFISPLLLFLLWFDLNLYYSSFLISNRKSILFLRSMRVTWFFLLVSRGPEILLKMLQEMHLQHQNYFFRLYYIY